MLRYGEPTRADKGKIVEPHRLDGPRASAHVFGVVRSNQHEAHLFVCRKSDAAGHGAYLTPPSDRAQRKPIVGARSLGGSEPRVAPLSQAWPFR